MDTKEKGNREVIINIEKCLQLSNLLYVDLPVQNCCKFHIFPSYKWNTFTNHVKTKTSPHGIGLINIPPDWSDFPTPQCERPHGYGVQRKQLFAKSILPFPRKWVVRSCPVLSEGRYFLWSLILGENCVHVYICNRKEPIVRSFHSQISDYIIIIIIIENSRGRNEPLIFNMQHNMLHVILLLPAIFWSTSCDVLFIYGNRFHLLFLLYIWCFIIVFTIKYSSYWHTGLYCQVFILLSNSMKSFSSWCYLILIR